jgi:hypothetical protein
VLLPQRGQVPTRSGGVLLAEWGQVLTRSGGVLLAEWGQVLTRSGQGSAAHPTWPEKVVVEN